jgi:hypothetical protein
MKFCNSCSVEHFSCNNYNGCLRANYEKFHVLFSQTKAKYMFVVVQVI